LQDHRTEAGNQTVHAEKEVEQVML